ncbi:MAG: DMT family transporter [Bacteroidota bacterium]
MKSNNSNSFALLTLAIILMSTSGAMGRMISLSPAVAIWIRCLLAVPILLVVVLVRRKKLIIKDRKVLKWITLSGILLGLHWVTYFRSLHLSTVSIGMLALFTYPVFTAILEPFILKTKFDVRSILLAVLAFAGIAIMVPSFSLEDKYTLGIVIGLISAVVYAVRNILVKKISYGQSGVTLMLYQLVVVLLLFWPLLLSDPTFSFGKVIANWEALLFLSVFTTAVAHTLLVICIKQFNVTTLSTLTTTGPIFGSIFGYFLLDEVPSCRTMIGGAVILLVVVLESIRHFSRKVDAN